MKRRIFAVILSCLMVLSLIPFAAFAADEHKHSYTSTTVIEASCTTTGIKKLVCACGDTKYEAIPKHTLDAGVVKKEATCTTDGSVEKTCLACGEKVTETIEAFDHKYVETVKPATCARPAQVGQFCSRCGELKPETQPTPIGEKVDHYYKENSKYAFVYTKDDKGTEETEDDEIVKVPYAKATCVESGYAFKPCIYCNKLAEEIAGDKTVEEILAIYFVKAAGHKWNDGVLAPGTCDDCDGFTHTIFTCTVCNGLTLDEADEKDVPSDTHAANHDYVKDEKQSSEATCVKDGKEVYVCSHCGDSYTKTNKKSGHDYEGAELKTQEATCTDTGYYYWLCKNGCGTEKKKVDDDKNVIVIEIDPTNHGDHETTGEVMVPNTCTSSGIEKLYCSGCNAAVGYGPIAAKHTEKEGTSEVKTDKTCDEDGLRTYECAVCGQTIEEVIPFGHDDKEEVLEEATCTKPGSKRLTCLDCGDQRIEPIPQLKHNYESGYFAADCENPGRTGKICTVCGASEGEVVIDKDAPALGHKINETVVPASCGVSTHIKRECTVCGDVKTEFIPGVNDALAHEKDTSYAGKHVNASCTEDEVDIYKCKRCGYYTETKEGYAKKTGHKLELNVPVAATCSTYGYIADICKNEGCDYKENVRVLNDQAPDGKTHIGVVSTTDFVLEPDCITGASGIARIVCKLCGEYTKLNDFAYAVAPYAHNFADGRYVKEAASCTVNGTYGFKCVVCKVEASDKDIVDYELETTITAGHSYGSSVIVSDTVCGGIWREETCIVCSYVHKFQKKNEKGTGECVYETQVFVKTCTVDAYVADVCTLCGGIDEDSVLVIADDDGISGYYGVNHEEAKDLIDQTKGATCTAPAQEQKYCTRCEKIVKSVPVGEPKGHSGKPSDDEDIFEVEATCEKGGYTFYICTVCDENVELTASAKLPCALEKDAGYETKNVYLAGKETTCVDGGYYTVACKNCGKNVSEEVHFEAASDSKHSYNETIILKPNCKTKGIKKLTCKYCGDFSYEQMDIEHDWDAGVRVKDECSAKKDKKYYVECLFTCTTCGATDTRKAYKPHEYGSFTTTVEATCQPGSQYRVCKVCDKKETKTIKPAYAHEYSEEAMYIPADCENGIRIGVACVNCFEKKGKTWDYEGKETAPHDTVEIHVPADCVTDEHFLVQCKNCTWEQEISFDGAAKKTGHKDGTPVYVGGGYHAYTCTVCDAVTKKNCYEESLSIAESLTDLTVTPTRVGGNCQQGSHYVFDCLACREVNALIAGNADYPISGEKDENVHAYDVKTVILAPTCATAGIYRLTCSCEAENVPATYAPAPKLPTHTYGEQLTSAGKYTTMYEVCSVCEYINVVFTTKETPLTDAEKNCLVGKHVSETVGAKAPTQCEDGMTAYTKCKHCDIILTEGKVVEAPHKYSVVSEGFDANGEYVVMWQCELCKKTKVDVH